MVHGTEHSYSSIGSTELSTEHRQKAKKVQAKRLKRDPPSTQKSTFPLTPGRVRSLYNPPLLLISTLFFTFCVDINTIYVVFMSILCRLLRLLY